MSHVSTWVSALFGQLPAHVEADVRRRVEPLTAKRGEPVFNLGEDPEAMFGVVSGQVKLTRKVEANDPRRESLLTLVAPGRCFGELSLLDPGPRTTSAIALSDCRLERLRGEDLQDLLATHPSIATGLIAQLARRLRHATDYAAELVLNDVHGRTAAVLLHLDRNFADETGRSGRVHHGLTQQEIAHMVGASRESVNKILMEYTESGLIELSHRAFTIVDPEGLASRADAYRAAREVD